MLTPQDLWFYIGSLCAILITAFLVWALYEIARLVRSANQVVHETRDKLERFEASMIHIGEKLTGMSAYLGLIAEGAKQAFTYFRKKSRKEELEEELADLKGEKVGEGKSEEEKCEKK